MTSYETRSGGRHCADVNGAFSPGWGAGPRAMQSGQTAIHLRGALWERARMTAETRSWLIRLYLNKGDQLGTWA